MHRITALAAAAAVVGLVSGQNATDGIYTFTTSKTTTASVPYNTPPPQTGHENPNISIASVSFSGNGCPQSTNARVVEFDQIFDIDKPSWLYFDLGSAFNTSIGPGTAVSDHTKNCQAHVSLRYGGGFQFAATAALVTGYAQLDPSVAASWFETYFFSQDASATQTVEATVQGGGEWARWRPFSRWDESQRNETVWSPCGGNGILNVNLRSALSSSNPTASGKVSVADLGTGWNAGLRLEWSKCGS